MTAPYALQELARLRRRHLRFGWWTLLVFVLAGVFLEALHGFKVDWYLDPAHETRRLLFRLGHAHGTVLALVQIAFALTLSALSEKPKWSSPCLMGAGLAIPGGFFLGGIDPHGGDPGLGIIALPIGAVLLIVAVAGTARALGAAKPDGGGGGGAGGTSD